MFDGLRNKSSDDNFQNYQNYQNYQNTTEEKVAEDEKKYHICVETDTDDSYIVDDCEQNWDILRDINNETAKFALFKDTKDEREEVFGIRVDKIVAFYLEEDD